MTKKRKASGVSSKKTSEQKDTVEKARETYDRGVLSRGEAAPCDKAGKLPLPYTHEIVDGKIVRRRYSIV
jgi:hypothetical protein